MAYGDPNTMDMTSGGAQPLKKGKKRKIKGVTTPQKKKAPKVKIKMPIPGIDSDDKDIYGQ